MKIKLFSPKPDPTFDWHEWYAWRPVIAKERGYYTDATCRGCEFLIWGQYVMRRKVIIDSTEHWHYEER